MSTTALAWAMKINAPSAPAKFVLACMANFADDRNQCFAGVDKLADATQLTEVAVRDALHKLADANLIAENAGTTSHKRVFTLRVPGRDE
ncbi:MAG: helix-turn-helix domain-containing protein [Telluria sp.]